MATQNLERLVVSLSADLRKYENGMRKAQATTNKHARKVEKRFERMNKKVVSQFKNLGRGLVAGLVAGGIGGIVASFGAVAESVAAIGDEAKRAGVTTRVFQEWSTVAKQARIPVDALIDGLKELNLRGDEFAVTGKGPAAEAFARLGFGAAELKKELKDPSALLLEIIDRLGKFDKAAQIRISDEIFGGTAGERFVELISQGRDGIQDTITEAHRLGNVLSDDVITRASEVDRQFKIVSQTVGTALKFAIVEAAAALQAFIESFRAFENQQSATLNNELSDIGSKRLGLETKILRLRDQQRDAIVGNPFGADHESMIAQLEAENAGLGDQEQRILAVLEARRKAQQVAPASTPFVPPPYVPPPPGGGTGGSKSGAGAFDNQAARLRALTAELVATTAAQAKLNPLIEDYGFAVEKAAATQDLLSAAQRAGIEITPELRAKIDELADGYANAVVDAERLAESQDNIRQAAEDMRSLGKDVLGGFISDLRSGTSASQALANALGKIVDKLLEISLNSIFDGGGIGNLFGFKDGGIAAHGKPLPRFAGGGVCGAVTIPTAEALS